MRKNTFVLQFVLGSHTVWLDYKVYQIKYCEKYLKFKGKRVVQKPTEIWVMDEMYWRESSW